MPNVSIMQNNSGKWDSVEFASSNGALLGLSPTTGAPQVALGISFDSSGNVALTGNLTMGAKYVEIVNMTAPAAPAATKARIYAADNGGKVTLYALFPSGAAQVIAAEP